MTKTLVIAGIIALVVLFGTTVDAAQNLTVEPDGTIAFEASTTGVTRLSIKGDRIRRLINTATDFEMTNDAETGDVFLRYLGAELLDPQETGFIVSEAGITIGYVLTPVEGSVETVVISVEGDDGEALRDEASGGLDPIGFSDDIAAFATSIVRDVARTHVLGHPVPGGRDGRVVRQISGQGWTASLRVAVAGQSPRLVREQEFYSAGVLAVWVQKPALAAGERTWVIVVEGN